MMKLMSVQRKLYIDIDGVLLGKKSPNDHEICLAEGAEDFLRFALSKFDCYWLTTNANRGDAKSALKALRPYVGKSFLELAGKVKPTKWKTLKTEAIDFSNDFYWIEDQLLWSEKNVLEKHGCLNRWIQINTRQDPTALSSALPVLAS